MTKSNPNGLLRSSVSRLKAAAKKRLKKKHRLQQTRSSTAHSLTNLGSEYGGWTFAQTDDLQGSVIISAGLGEDASFDVEFAAKYSAKVVIVDPTPRAISHFEKLKTRIGSPNTMSYVKGGQQPIEAYDLSSISGDQIQLVEKALWKQSETLRFFQPTDPLHVSHSIVNYQNDYRTDTDYIEVEALTVAEVLNASAIAPEDVALIKFDIEGAEIEVIAQMLEDGIKPRQICVEFDEFSKPSQTAYRRVEEADRALREHGYSCVFTDGDTDFLYVRKPL